MASRRVRIKGIANIPQRRKATQQAAVAEESKNNEEEASERDKHQHNLNNVIKSDTTETSIYKCDIDEINATKSEKDEINVNYTSIVNNTITVNNSEKYEINKSETNVNNIENVELNVHKSDESYKNSKEFDKSSKKPVNNKEYKSEIIVDDSLVCEFDLKEVFENVIRKSSGFTKSNASIKTKVEKNVTEISKEDAIDTETIIDKESTLESESVKAEGDVIKNLRSDEKNVESENALKDENKSGSSLIRRRFLKPTIVASQIRRKIKFEPNLKGNSNQEVAKQTEKEETLNETILPIKITTNNADTSNINNTSNTSNKSNMNSSFNINSNTGINRSNTNDSSDNNRPNITHSSNLNKIWNINNSRTDDETSSVLNTAHPKPILKKFIEDVKSGSDTEYPAMPASPTKVLQRRIKAVPRLSHQRRISFSVHGSASESEDDSRRSSFSRVRTESVCSVASEAQQPVVEQSTTVKSVPVKRNKRSDHYRKLAEARREFDRKFATMAKPDRQKLTMMDLIFYNPTTNLMSEKKRKRTDTTSSVQSDAKSERIESEIVDNPPENEENAIPAPQIKIGANGEIIIDEQSLVIENESTKVNRTALQESQVVDGDFDVSVGYLKKPRKRKEWSHSETIRFYKALNTIGTDFMMMCELFPGRNRHDLKMKFKKEEKINRALVDKALTQPQQFGMELLLRDLEEEQREKRMDQARKNVIAKIREECKRKKTRIVRKNNICVTVEGPEADSREKQQEETCNAEKQSDIEKQKFIKRQNNTGREDDLEKQNGLEVDKPLEREVQQEKSKNDKSKQAKGKSNYDYVRRGILSVLDEEERNNSVRDNKKRKEKNLIQKEESESDTDIVASDEDSSEDECDRLQLRATRTGRIPKPRQIFEMSHESHRKRRKLDRNKDEGKQNEELAKLQEELLKSSDYIQKLNENMEETNEKLDESNEVEGPQQLQPGSIMILSHEGQSGPVYEVFMVTPSQDKVKLDLAPEIIGGLVATFEEGNIDKKRALEKTLAMPEENITIAENVTMIEDVTITEHIAVAEDVTIAEENITIAEDDCETLRPKQQENNVTQVQASETQVDINTRED